ncbi:histidine phosphatase superfamily [Amanita rubescens]|nr:histidine phosphatase superfamily [Amanita rubescens]
MSRPCPRLILVRHGETEWSITWTGRSDIPLTTKGEQVVKDGAGRLVGDDLIIDPKRCLRAIISPRQRAQKTFHLAFLSEDVREWDYGDYDGLVTADILKINPAWNIWNDGCPGGESVEQMQQRVDSVIAKVCKWHQEYLEDSTSDKPDVIIFAHGHFGRVLITRWLGFPLAEGKHFNLGTASVSVLGHGHKGAERVLEVLNVQF